MSLKLLKQSVDIVQEELQEPKGLNKIFNLWWCSCCEENILKLQAVNKTKLRAREVVLIILKRKTKNLSHIKRTYRR